MQSKYGMIPSSMSLIQNNGVWVIVSRQELHMG
jgi:hypothetical protein